MLNTATQAQATNQQPKLLDQVVAKMRVKHYSLRTEKSYMDWIKRYIWHFDKQQQRAKLSTNQRPNSGGVIYT